MILVVDHTSLNRVQWKPDRDYQLQSVASTGNAIVTQDPAATTAQFNANIDGAAFVGLLGTEIFAAPLNQKLSAGETYFIYNQANGAGSYTFLLLS